MGKTRAYAFCDGKISEVGFKEAAKLRAKKGMLFWVDIENPSKEDLKTLVKDFRFHHLPVEDAGNMQQRCKTEEYEDFVFIVLRVFPKGGTEATQLNFFLDGNILVTVHFKCVEAIDEVAEVIMKNPSLLGRGPDFLAYQIIDHEVDNLFPHLDEVEEGIDAFETDMLKAASADEVGKRLSNLFALKKKNLAIRKIAWPMRDVLTVLSHREYKYIRPENAVYFRDVYDHMLRISDMTEMNRELLAASMEAYLAVISNNLNLVMKKLAALAAMFGVPLLIAGIYGMNFKFMPELDYPYGYYIALGEMLFASVLMFIYFRINKWI